MFICHLVLQTLAEVYLVDFKRRIFHYLSLVKIVLTCRIATSLNLTFYVVPLKTYGLRTPLPLIVAHTPSDLVTVLIVITCRFVRQFN